MKRACILLIFACIAALSYAQFFDDIYYDSSKDGNETKSGASEAIAVNSPAESTGSSYADQIASAYAADDNTAGLSMDIDEYNRRGATRHDTATTEEAVNASKDFKYTEQIMKYYNPDLVDENDPQYQYLFDHNEDDAYYSYNDIDIILTPAWSYGNFWYDPWWNWNYGWGWSWSWSPYSWYNPWYYPFHPYYPYYGPGWYPAPVPPHRPHHPSRPPHTGGGGARPAGANPRTAGSQAVYQRNEHSAVSGNYRSTSGDRSYSTSGSRYTGNSYNGATRGSSSSTYRSSGSSYDYNRSYSGASRGSSSRNSYYTGSYGGSRGSSSRGSSYSTGSSYRNNSAGSSFSGGASRGSSSRGSSFSTGGASRGSSFGGASRGSSGGGRSAGRR